MKIIALYLILFISGISGANAQKIIKGSGYILTQQREVHIYNSIEVNGPLHVFATPDELRPVIIEADNNLFPYIKTELKQDTLKIYIEPGISIENFAAMNIFLSTPGISNLKATNGANIDGSHTSWKNKQTNIEAYGNTKINWHTLTGTLNVSGQNNVIITLKGTAKTFNLTLGQNSLLDASGLNAVNARMNISAGSKATIQVSGTISYDISNKGRLIYKGLPEILKASTTSGGKASKRK